MKPLAVLGAGAFGTALANIAASAGRPVILWARDAEQAGRMRETGENARYLPGVRFAAGIEITSDLGRCADADTMLAAAPAQALRETIRNARGVWRRQEPDIVICAKGIERGTNRFPSEIAAELWPSARIAILSGPSFAADIARGLPTAVTLAAEDEAMAERLCKALGTRSFRLYHSTDVRGVEIGGAAKNVLAIACGIASGLGLGASANAALTTRGFAELMRFGKAFGSRPETLMGLSGLGDLLLTCTSPQSRNFSLGLQIGRAGRASKQTGAPPFEIGQNLAEGAFTAPVLVKLAENAGIEMPIAASVAAILAGTIDVPAAVNALLLRPLKSER